MRIRTAWGAITLLGFFSLQLTVGGCADTPEEFQFDPDLEQDVDDIGVEEDGGQNDSEEDSLNSDSDSALIDKEQSDCPEDPNKDQPGYCGCGVPDEDSDGDGTLDCEDNCPADPNKVTPEVCGCGRPDEDRDGDGVFDCDERCPNDPDKELAGICGCGVPEDDSDEDGVPDCKDDCPDDFGKTTPGSCGCGYADDDDDGDGVINCHDGCPGDRVKVVPGKCGCGNSENSCLLRCLEAWEHEYAALACGGQSIISSIEFASFGDPEGSCSGGEPTLGSCHGDKSIDALEKACLGQAQCMVLAEKSVMGDPHCGKKVQERLLVQYICRIPTPSSLKEMRD